MAKRKKKREERESGERRPWAALVCALCAFGMAVWTAPRYIDFVPPPMWTRHEAARLMMLRGFVPAAWATVAVASLCVFAHGGWRAARTKARVWMGVGFLASVTALVALREFFGVDPGA